MKIMTKNLSKLYKMFRNRKKGAAKLTNTVKRTDYGQKNLHKTTVN